MDEMDQDLDDSALYFMPSTQKRKAITCVKNDNPKQPKLINPESCSSKTKSLKNRGTETLENSHKNNTSVKTQDDDGRDKNNLEMNSDDEPESYFTSNRRTSSMNCPLCLKLFETDATHSAHMKQCAKRNKMTTQQLLKALELQKKQLEERRALGLPSQIVPAVRKPASKKKVQPDYDLALGLALSMSLEENKLKSSKHDTEVQKSTLKEFGFTTNKEPSIGKKKLKTLKKSVLRERTKEERQGIVAEKAAVVLLDEDQEDKVENPKPSANWTLRNEQLVKLRSEVPHLWNLGENDGKRQWYVKNVENMLLSEEEKAPVQEIPPPPPEDIQDEIFKLKLPKSNVYQDWRKMINSEKLSDLNGRSKDGQTFYFHSLVLFVRGFEILNEDYKSVFKKFDLSTIVIFLEFLYCGTLNGLVRSEIENLSKLAVDFNYEELISVLNCLKINMSSPESSEGVITSSLTPEPEIAVAEAEEVTIVAEDRDLFEDMVDLTQSSHGSSNDKDKFSEDESNVEKSYWSFLQHEKKKEEEEELRRREEEKESTEISIEMEKIESCMRQQHEMMQKILNEYEERETNLKNDLELEEICQVERRESSESMTRESDADKKNCPIDDCIVLSSDSETRMSKAENISENRKSPMDCDFDVPYYNPWDDFSPVSLRENFHSQSLVSGNFFLGSEEGKTNEEESFELEQEKDGVKDPKYFSTPVSNRRSTPRVGSSSKELLNRSRRRKSVLATSRIIRKSLGLSLKCRNQTSSAKSIRKRKSRREEKELAEVLSGSILKELSKSPMFKSLTPVRSKQFVAVTPYTKEDFEFTDSVTPPPCYREMSPPTLKVHLSKYGLKKSLCRSKAIKILQYIYEELHPFLNTETGEIVKKLPSQTPKPRKKKTKTAERGKKKESAMTKTTKKTSFSPTKSGSLSNSAEISDGSVDSLNRSTDYDSDGSEFGDLNEPLTQSAPNDPVDLPSALNEFLEINPDFHRKILLYEPIWLEDLHKKLKETFQKRFKLSDLMDYLDEKCITFRLESQKRNNEKRNEKRKNGSKRKKTSSS